MTRDQLIETMARGIDLAAWAEPTTASLTPLWKEPRKRQSLETARAALTAIEAAGMRVESAEEMDRLRSIADAWARRIADDLAAFPSDTAQEDSTSE
jgi:hypothetical protein